MVEEAVLFVVVLVMAAVSASVGPAGGVVFAAMAVVLPATAVVPVHAALQAGGSSIRLTLLRRYVSRPRLAAFAAGALVGFLPAALLASRLRPDPNLLRCGLGLATLVPIMIRPAAAGAARQGLGRVAALGGWTSFLALFVGATGAMVGAVLSRTSIDAKERVATHTGCLWLQHLAKLVLYSGLGFSFSRYLPLIGLLLVASAAGAVIGRRLLTRSSGATLSAVFEIVIMALGSYLFTTAALALLLSR